MKITLREVDPYSRKDLRHLYNLLAERKPYQSISHKRMPPFDDHVAFARMEPYKAWYLIVHDGFVVGNVYLTKANELGIGIYDAHKGRGYGKAAIEEVMSRFDGPFLANINPLNNASIEFFTALGFTKLQVTYVHE